LRVTDGAAQSIHRIGPSQIRRRNMVEGDKARRIAVLRSTSENPGASEYNAPYQD
jgi:hypothetical protein